MVSIASTRRGFIGASAAAAAMSLAPRRSRAAELQKVRIITTSGNLTWEEILRQKRYMEELGIEAETSHVSDGTKIIGSLLNGESDIARSAPSFTRSWLRCYGRRASIRRR